VVDPLAMGRRTTGRVLLAGFAALASVACSAIEEAPVDLAPDPAPLGVARGATVALDPTTVDGPLVYLAGRLDASELARLREVASGVEIVAGLDRTTALEHAARAHGADAHLLTPEFLAAADRLAWVQSWSAGVERYLALPGFAEREGLVFTNAKGVHGPVIAEHVFALLLHLTRRLDALGDAHDAGRWERGASAGATSLSGRTLLVAGLGGIGTEVARRGHAFGMTVLGTVRTLREPPPFVDELGTGADLDALLARADVLVVCLPLTDETRGLFDAERLARLRPGAFVVNIARGAILDTDALLAALDSGHLAGAGLDVTDPEPLPAGHPLWGRDDVLVTPHVAGRAGLTGARRAALIAENLRRFGAGEPLLNVVDRAAGY
jgi:phosphoglycerate dehydrogenase-like enzyme